MLLPDSEHHVQPVARSSRTPEDGSSRFAFCSCRLLLRTLMIVGGVLSIFGIVMLIFYRDIFVMSVKSQIPVRSDSPNLPMFERPPAIMRTSFYFFNLTNADRVTYYGEKPVVEEIGPYVYRLIVVKEDIQFSSDDTEVNYVTRKNYTFDRYLSIGDDTDVVVTLDLVAYSGLRGIHEKGSGGLGSTLLRQAGRQRPFKSYTVRELLWGTDDSLFEVFTSAGGNAKPPVFGLMLGKNGTVDGNFTVFTGKENIGQLQQLKVYNGQTRLDDIWPVVKDERTDEPFDANQIRGTLGKSFSPGVSSESKLTVFAHDVCFAIDFVYRQEAITQGVSTLRFGVDHHGHQRSTGAINRVICDEDEDSDIQKCALPGLLNMTKCRNGLPIVMSWPHFLGTSSYYTTMVDGMTPREDSHGPYIEVDSLTGMTLNGARRIQINFPLSPLPYDFYNALPEFTLYPIMWVEEAATISPEGMDALNELVYFKFRLVQFFAFATLIVGILMLAVSLLVYFIYTVACADALQGTTPA